MIRTALALLFLVMALPATAQNTCQYANDNECDEARFGGLGLCDPGTDTADCAQVSTGVSTDDCFSASDGQCDEYRFNGTGFCMDGTDASDCSAWQTEREATFMERATSLGVDDGTVNLLGDNTCRWSYDTECDDVNFAGTGACDPGTDAMDCLGQAPIN